MYHVNPKTGDIGICKAKSPETCPFGCENHSNSLDEIQIKADEINKKNKDYQSLQKMKVFDEIYNNADNELKGINPIAYYYYENSRYYNKKYIDIDSPFSDMNKETINNIVNTYREQGIKEFSISLNFSSNPKLLNDFVNAGARIDRIETLKDNNKEYTAFILKVDKLRENDTIEIKDKGIKAFDDIISELYNKETGELDYNKLFNDEYNKKADTNLAFAFYRRDLANNNKLGHIDLSDDMHSFLKDNDNINKTLQSFKDNNIKTFSISSNYSENPSYIKKFVDNGAEIVNIGKLANGKETFILEI